MVSGAAPRGCVPKARGEPTSFRVQLQWKAEAVKRRELGSPAKEFVTVIKNNREARRITDRREIREWTANGRQLQGRLMPIHPTLATAVANSKLSPDSECWGIAAMMWARVEHLPDGKQRALDPQPAVIFYDRDARVLAVVHAKTGEIIQDSRNMVRR